MQLDKSALFGQRIDINYRDPIIEKFAKFDDQLRSDEMSVEEVINKLIKDKYSARIQEFAEMLSNLRSIASEVMCRLPRANLVKPFVAGLIHNEQMSTPLWKYPDQLKAIKKIVKEAIQISEGEIKIALENELADLRLFKKHLVEEEQKVKALSIEPVFDESLYNLSMRQYPETRLTWEQLMQIHSTGLGLRHVSDQRTGKKEIADGCFGDAVAIYTGPAGMILKLLEQNALKCNWEHIEQQIGFKFSSSTDSNIQILNRRIVQVSDLLSIEDKKLVVSQFETTIYKFIQASICNFDHPINLSDPRESFFEKRLEAFATTSTFLIVEKNRDDLRPYDFEHYYHLGKFGKGPIRSNEMKRMITIPKDALLKAFEESQEKNFTEQAIAINQAATRAVYQEVMEGFLQLSHK